MLVLALTAYGCGSANGGPLGGMGGYGGTGGVAGTGGMGGEGGAGGIAGTGGEGGAGGVGGTGGTPDLCADAATRCDDNNECTQNLCEPTDGMCSNPNETNGTSCDFSGLPGICTDGVCEDAGLCDDAATRCDDSNECTQNLCEPTDGVCSNPAEPDATVCEFAPGVGGVCTAGACEDAMLCADAATRCDDANQCTEDDCDPANGVCSNVAMADDTVCEFAPGVGGVCTAGTCQDAMLCADAPTRCDDSNDCTQDVCDPQDGMCSNPNEADDTVCDAAGNPGSCQTGMCVALCMPAPGLDVTLPTSGAPTPVYTDMANGFTISADNCGTQVNCDVTFTFRGISANTYGDGSAFDQSDSLLISFFDQDGIARTASNAAIVLNVQGTGGTVNVSVDGAAPVSLSATPGSTLDLSMASAHEIQVTSTPGLFVFWQALQYDHDCL